MAEQGADGYSNIQERVVGGGVSKVEFDPERANLVRETFRLYATGEDSILELQAAMHAKGLTTLFDRVQDVLRAHDRWEFVTGVMTTTSRVCCSAASADGAYSRWPKARTSTSTASVSEDRRAPDADSGAESDLDGWHVLQTAIKLAINCHAAYLKARPSVRHPFNQAVLEAAYVKDRKIARAEFSEVFAPLFLRSGSNKTLKVVPTGFEPVSPP